MSSKNGDLTFAAMMAWTPAIALMSSGVVMFACVSRSAVVFVIRDTIPLGLANTNLTPKYFLAHISQ
jgi:roadblock/LC7 domain-containing protein